MLAIYFAGRRFDSRCTIPLIFLRGAGLVGGAGRNFLPDDRSARRDRGRVFTALPKELVAAIAGIAVLGTIGNSLHGALREEGERDAALITFLVTASGLTLVGIGSAFGGLLFGLAVLQIGPRQQT